MLVWRIATSPGIHTKGSSKTCPWVQEHRTQRVKPSGVNTALDRGHTTDWPCHAGKARQDSDKSQFGNTTGFSWDSLFLPHICWVPNPPVLESNYQPKHKEKFLDLLLFLLFHFLCFYFCLIFFFLFIIFFYFI